MQKIILKGSIQLTAEQKRRMMEEKFKKIVNKISREAINPQTGHPHPPKRIERAMKECKIHIDPFKPVDEQIKEVLKAIRTKIPIKFEKVKIAVKIPGKYVGSSYGTITKYCKILEEEWQDDGSWIGIVELPGGLQNKFYEELSKLTAGEVETKLLRE